MARNNFVKLRSMAQRLTGDSLSDYVQSLIQWRAVAVSRAPANRLKYND
jgi:hypothetical protein